MPAGLWPHVRMLKHFMLHGPRIFGCWEGDASTDICGRLSGVATTMWHANLEECEELIDRRVQSVAVCVEVAAVALLAYNICSIVLQYAWLRIAKPPMWGHMWGHPQPLAPLPPAALALK